MTRDEVYREIESMFGFVPTPFKVMSDQMIEQEWNTWKAIEAETGTIDRKTKEMISLGIMGAIQDKYGIFYRTETAKKAGVSDEEMKAIAELVKQEVGWGPFLRLNQVDFDQFKQETMRAMEQFQKKQEAQVRTSM